MLNELFTGAVPHGTEYQQIASVSKAHAYLDDIVALMLRQSPRDRPTSIAALKGLIQRYEGEAVTLQRLSEINATVIPESQIDDPLALEPPKLVNVGWDAGRLTLTLDRPVTGGWIDALNNMKSYTSVMGIGPQTFSFRGHQASVPVSDTDAQRVIDYFKTWLPLASHTLRTNLLEAATKRQHAMKVKLLQQREQEERRLRANRALKI